MYLFVIEFDNKIDRPAAAFSAMINQVQSTRFPTRLNEPRNSVFRTLRNQLLMR